MDTKRFLHRHLSFAVVPLSAALILTALTPRPAEAVVGGCVSDPFVILSNRTMMHLYAVLPRTSVGDLQSVSYTVVVPVGASVVLEVNTDGVVGTKEHFQFSATNPPDEYDTTTLVQTQARGDPVMATTTVLTGGPSGDAMASKSIMGYTNQPLTIHLDLQQRQ
jgi:hypothetical protein